MSRILQNACLIHEIGLSVDFKHAPQHAAYLIRNLDLPGFTPAQKLLLSALLQNQSDTIDLSLLNQQNALPADMAQHLCRLLRLAIIFPAVAGMIPCQQSGCGPIIMRFMCWSPKVGWNSTPTAPKR